MIKSQRRYDIDMWRVIAILAVYLHHIGMPFNGDNFHIMNADSSKLLDDIMVFFEQFRLPMLFLISGAGTVYAFSKRTWIQFVGERAYRLLIPLIFGMFVIVPPQTYFENIIEFRSYSDFYFKILENIEVNHLWFIENLFYISILTIPIIIFFRSIKSNKIRHWIANFTSNRFGIFLWVIPLIIIKIISKNYFPDDSKDILNLSSTLFYGYFFVAGILMTTAPMLWESLKNYRRFNLKMTIVSVLIFYAYYFLPNEIASQYFTIEARWDIWYGVSAFVSWSLITTLLGYGQIWFNKKSEILRKANEAIYPFYVLHQTVIIVLAYYVVQMDASILVKIGLLLFSSFPIIILVYRFLIYPFRIPRFLFGMKKNSSSKLKK